MATPSTRPAPVSVTLESFDALDFGVCCCPLRPPIFQCPVGHVLCSTCRDKLASAGICHVCRAPVTGGYRRNHDMEKLVESIRVPCPNAAFGCSAKPAYYDYHPHLLSCLHAPCHCPATACYFVGSTPDPTDHFSTAHQWPCIKVQGPRLSGYRFHDGFNVLDVVDGDRKHLFLLLVSRERVGRAIALAYVCPRIGTDVAFCTLQVQVSRCNSVDGDESGFHVQRSEFRLAPTDLSSGLPNPDGCFHLIVPKYAHQPDEQETIEVSASIRPSRRRPSDASSIDR